MLHVLKTEIWKGLNYSTAKASDGLAEKSLRLSIKLLVVIPRSSNV